MGALTLPAALLAGAGAGWLLRGSRAAVGLGRRLSGVSLWGLLLAMGAGLGREGWPPAGGAGPFLLALGSAALLAAVFFLASLAARPRAAGRGDGPAGGAGGRGRELLAVAANAGCIALGFALHRLLPPGLAAALPPGPLAAWLLCALIFFVGFDLGAELRRLDPRPLAGPLLLAPFLNIAASLAVGAAFGSLTALGARDGALLTAGMGWYSLSSAMLAERGMAALALLAFVHNVSRELLAILCAPLAARVSPMLPVYLGGATSMDVMLPFVQRYSGRGHTLASFYSGAVCSLAVMPLVAALAG